MEEYPPSHAISHINPSPPIPTSPTNPKSKMPSFACPSIRVSPVDNCAGLPTNMLQCEDPSHWNPKRSLHLKAFAPWGFGNNPEEEGIMFYQEAFMRTAHLQVLYGFNVALWPEVQFIRRLILQKHLRIAAGKPLADKLATRDYILFLKMPIIDAYGAVTRTVVVSGGMTMRALQDKVLQPVLGYARNYHGYLFIDGKDGCVYGACDSQALDMCHLNARHVWEMVDDERLRVCDVLQREGEDVEYVYDLGDWWRHTISVKKILEVGQSSGKVRVLGGTGFWLPENGCGNFLYNEFLNKFRMASSLEGKREILYAVYEKASNWQTMFCIFRDEEWTKHFKPAEFDVFQAEENVKEALESRLSTQSGTHYRMDMFNRVGHIEKVSRVATKPDNMKTGGTCANCGSPHNLKRCSRCKNILYCSQDCQLKAWRNGHKLNCQAFNKQK